MNEYNYRKFRLTGIDPTIIKQATRNMIFNMMNEYVNDVISQAIYISPFSKTQINCISIMLFQCNVPALRNGRVDD